MKQPTKNNKSKPSNSTKASKALPPGVSQRPSMESGSQTGSTTRGLSDPKDIIKVLKSLHDSFFYQSFNIPTSIEEKDLVKFLGPGDLLSWTIQICDFVEGLIPKCLHDLERMFERMFGEPLAQYIETICGYVDRSTPVPVVADPEPLPIVPCSTSLVQSLVEVPALNISSIPDLVESAEKTAAHLEQILLQYEAIESPSEFPVEVFVGPELPTETQRLQAELEDRMEQALLVDHKIAQTKAEIAALEYIPCDEDEEAIPWGTVAELETATIEPVLSQEEVLIGAESEKKERSGTICLCPRIAKLLLGREQPWIARPRPTPAPLEYPEDFPPVEQYMHMRPVYEDNLPPSEEKTSDIVDLLCYIDQMATLTCEVETQIDEQLVLQCPYVDEQLDLLVLDQQATGMLEDMSIEQCVLLDPVEALLVGGSSRGRGRNAGRERSASLEELLREIDVEDFPAQTTRATIVEPARTWNPMTQQYDFPFVPRELQTPEEREASRQREQRFRQEHPRRRRTRYTIPPPPRLPAYAVSPYAGIVQEPTDEPRPVFHPKGFPYRRPSGYAPSRGLRVPPHRPPSRPLPPALLPSAPVVTTGTRPADREFHINVGAKKKKKIRKQTHEMDLNAAEQMELQRPEVPAITTLDKDLLDQIHRPLEEREEEEPIVLEEFGYPEEARIPTTSKNIRVVRAKKFRSPEPDQYNELGEVIEKEAPKPPGRPTLPPEERKYQPKNPIDPITGKRKKGRPPKVPGIPPPPPPVSVVEQVIPPSVMEPVLTQLVPIPEEQEVGTENVIIDSSYPRPPGFIGPLPQWYLPEDAGIIPGATYNIGSFMQGPVAPQPTPYIVSEAYGWNRPQDINQGPVIPIGADRFSPLRPQETRFFEEKEEKEEKETPESMVYEWTPTSQREREEEEKAEETGIPMRPLPALPILKKKPRYPSRSPTLAPRELRDEFLPTASEEQIQLIPYAQVEEEPFVEAPIPLLPEEKLDSFSAQVQPEIEYEFDPFAPNWERPIEQPKYTFEPRPKRKRAPFIGPKRPPGRPKKAVKVSPAESRRRRREKKRLEREALQLGRELERMEQRQAQYAETKARKEPFKQDLEEQNRLYSEDLLQRARQLGIDPWSEHLKEVFTYEALEPIYRRGYGAKKVDFKYTQFLFSAYPYGLPAPPAFMNRGTAMEQTSRLLEDRLERWVENVVQRQVTSWRLIAVFENAEGEEIVQSTPWMDEFKTSKTSLDYIISLKAGEYSEEGIHLKEIKVRVMLGRQGLLVGGAMNRTKIQQKLTDFQKTWCIVNPRSKTNCLWSSIAICRGYASNPKLLTDAKTQNKAGEHLKKSIGTRNSKGGNHEDLQKMANQKNLRIHVYMNLAKNTEEESNIHLAKVFVPEAHIPYDEDPQTISLLLMTAHYHALLPQTDPVVAEHGTEYEDKPLRELRPISRIDKEFEARRICVYDLEAYQQLENKNHEEVKFQGDFTGDADVVNQIAYAAGWGLEVKSDEEKEKLEALGYHFKEFDWLGTHYRFAMRHELGEGCLNKMLEEWMTNPLFDQCVMYAHNGGKYDFRLIMGQSNLFSAQAYRILPDRMIELNGRFINVDIENIGQEYDDFVFVASEGRMMKRCHCVSVRDSVPLFGAGSDKEGQGCGLAKLCKELDVPHKKMVEKVNVHKLQFEHTWRENWDKYEMALYFDNDLLGLWEVLTKFNLEVQADTEIPITAINTGASLAKKYYLKTYYHTNEQSQSDPSKTIFTLDPTTDGFIRDSYGGGRCEAFVSKEVPGPVYYYDFTSLYPDVGREKMPTGKPEWVIEPGHENEESMKLKLQRLWKLRIQDKKSGGRTAFWKVQVWSPRAMAGFPMDSKVRKPLFGLKEDSMYIFRWFDGPTAMTIYEPELLFAIEQGLDYEFLPLNCIVFYTNPILKTCMEDLFRKKKEAKQAGKEALCKAWKIIINSLYGVWGLKCLGREGVQIARPQDSTWAMDLACERLMDLEVIGNYIVTRSQKDLEVADCNVAIAAAVTSEARMKLYRLMVDIQDHQGEILYCDTDSIITTLCLEEHPDLSDKWIGPTHGEALGSLKNEIDECYEKLHKDPKYRHLVPGKGFSECVIVAPKLYLVQAEQGVIVKKAHKGYKENTETGDIVTYDRMSKLVDLDLEPEARIMDQRTTQWKGGNGDLLKKGETFNIGVRLVQVTKTIRQTINKGDLQEDGTIAPLTRPKRDTSDPEDTELIGLLNELQN